MNKNNAYIYVISFAVALAIVGGYFYPRIKESTNATGSPVDSTFSTAKIAQINITPSIETATSTSIQNTDTSNRWVTGSYVACTGVGTSLTAYTGAGLASLTVKAATTTTRAPATVSNTNLVMDAVVSTSTPFAFNAATSTGTSNPGLLIWSSGSYMTWFFNATNTAACSVGISYIAS